MTLPVATQPGSFVDRRTPDANTPSRKRRQFSDNRTDLSPAAEELAEAIDTYKLVHRRRFITYEEMLSVVESLRYSK